MFVLYEDIIFGINKIVYVYEQWEEEEIQLTSLLTTNNKILICDVIVEGCVIKVLLMYLKREEKRRGEGRHALIGESLRLLRRRKKR